MCGPIFIVRFYLRRNKICPVFSIFILNNLSAILYHKRRGSLGNTGYRMNQLENFKGKEIRVFCWASMAFLFIAAFAFDTPKDIMLGMAKIITARDILITDYFALTGYGAAFFNAGCTALIAIVCITAVRLPFTGLTVAAIFAVPDLVYGDRTW